MGLRIVNEEFRDFDLFRDVLSGWDTDVTQLSPGPLHLTWREAAFDNQISLSHLITNRSLTDRMAINHGRITFVVCFAANKFCGLEVPAGSLLIFGPGREYRSVLPSGFESFEICASIDFLRDNGLTIADESFDDLRPERCVLSLSDHHLHEFRRLSRAFSSLATDHPDQTLWAEAARERAINLIICALQPTGRVKPPTLTSHVSSWLLTTRALEKLEQDASRGVTVAAVSRRLDCSSRALQVAFKDVLGISPSQYILARRLQLARRDLLLAKPDNRKVTHVAAKHEFFHFGRFSQYYRAFFGELPSDTLKKSCRMQHDRP